MNTVSKLKLIGARVLTESGIYLGSVSDVEVIGSELRVTTFQVKRTVVPLLGHPLWIDLRMVVRLEPETIIVKDAAVPASAARVLKNFPFSKVAPKPSFESRRAS